MFQVIFLPSNNAFTIMPESNHVEHKGFVKEIGKDTMKVSILSVSACGSCVVKGACGISDMQEKIIDVKRPDWNVEINQTVTLAMKETLGFLALFFGYGLPFLAVLITLIVSMAVTGNEGISGLLALVILVPYYLALYSFRFKMRSKFEFVVKPY